MKTQILPARDAATARDAIAAATAALRRGEVVAVPTETVYGLAALPGREAELRAAKGRDDGKPFTWAVADRAAAEKLVDLAARPAAKLAARYWPGPLTLVLPRRGGGGDAVGVRVPGHAWCQELLRGLDGPLLLTSANRSGERDAVEAQEVAAALDGAVAWIVDGGKAALGQPSTVVSFAGDRAIVHREGVIDRAMVLRTAARTILFVCSGNTCRSPMAEALLRARWSARLGVKPQELLEHGGQVGSAGAGAPPGVRASEEAVELLAKRKIDLAAHRSRPLTPELMKQADEIWVMTSGHLRALRYIAADQTAKAQLLDPQGRDVVDPIGAGPRAYKQCLDQIERALEQRFAGML